MSANGRGRGCGGLRELVVDAVLGAGGQGVKTFDGLLERTALELERRAGVDAVNPFSLRPATRLPPGDSDAALDIAWDLAREGTATFCPDASGAGWPGLRRSRVRGRALRPGPDRFGEGVGFLAAMPLQAADVSHDARLYLEEAAAAFYVDRLLSASVMLALAAEGEFLRLLDTARASEAYGRHFSGIGDDLTLGAKIAQFREAMTKIRAGLPKSATDELDHNLAAIRSVMLAARDESGRPRGDRAPSRDRVYLNFHLFIPFARQAKRLRQELNGRPAPRAAPLRRARAAARQAPLDWRGALEHGRAR